ncbi:MAG: putative RNA uridine N3 methyltransferase [Halobacteriota archaeon]
MYTSVLVPNSLTRETGDRREATRKLGWIARAAAIFGVDDIVVFPDPEGVGPEGDAFVATVLRYATTPPYLRKEAFGRRDELAHVGVLPPLRHPTWTGSESNGSGSMREGIVTEVGPDGRVRVNCGLQHPISLVATGDDPPDEGERVAVSISSREPVRATLLDEEPPGPRVRERPLESALTGPEVGVRVATSRHGHPLDVGLLAGALAGRHERGLTVAFGAPGRGLVPICRSLGLDDRPPTRPGETPATLERAPPGSFDLWLNTIPSQASEVVRTEEAVVASLACLALEE